MNPVRSYLTILPRKATPLRESTCLLPLAADAAGELDVLGVDGHPFGVDCAEVGVLKEVNEVGLGCLLQRHEGMRLKTEVGLEDLSNLADEPLEGKLAEQKISRLLVFADLTERHGTRTEAMGLLHTTTAGLRLLGGFGSKGLTRSLAASGLASSLLGACHCGRSTRV